MRRLSARSLCSRSDDAPVNPMDSIGNLADAMLVLAVGIMLALIINWNVDISSAGQTADAPADPMALLEDWRARLGVDVLPDWEETQTVQAGATELRSVQGRLRLQTCAAHETFLLEAASFS